MNVTTRKVLFLSDLDGTWLSKNAANRLTLDQGVREIRDEYKARGIELKTGYVTARPPEFVAIEKLPAADWTVCFNGGSICQGDGASLQTWKELNQSTGFHASKAVAECGSLLETEPYQALTMHTVGETFHRPEPDACAYTATLCFDLSSISLTDSEKADANNNGKPDILEPETYKTPEQLRTLASDLSQRLAAAGMPHQVSPAYLAHGRPYLSLDVSSPFAVKGEAVDFLRDREGVTSQDLIIAGDGGNDLSMMRGRDGRDDGRRAIVVGADAGLRQAGMALSHGLVQPPSMDCALAVLDGLRRHLQAIAG